MAEEPNSQQQETQEPHGEAAEPQKDWQAEYEKLLEQSRKWEKRAKENSAKAKKYDEAQAASMTDKERADKAEAELQRYRKADERRKWVASVSKETGVPSDVLDGMEAEDEDELRARAESIAGYFKRGAAPVVPGAGVQPDTPTPGKTPNEWLRDSIPQRIKNSL